MPGAGDAVGAVEEEAKIGFEYDPLHYLFDPHRAPVLRFFESVHELRRVLDESRRRPLKADEAARLAALLEARGQPWLEWAGKREQPMFEVEPVALHIHERVSAQAILRAVRREDIQRDLFADTAQSPREAHAYYRHDIDWANRLITGDSLQVMTSLSRRENLAGQVQMIYMDPPYGIKFSSNWQNEVGKRDVKDKDEDLCREPEMIRAYRDTWTLGVHSYLAYLKQRLIVARELLKDSGSIFVQIGEGNLHRVRCIMEEVFGEENFISEISFVTTGGFATDGLSNPCNYLLWFAKQRARAQINRVYQEKNTTVGEMGCRWLVTRDGEMRSMRNEEVSGEIKIPDGSRIYKPDNIKSSGATKSPQEFEFAGRKFIAGASNHWKTNVEGLYRLEKAGRIHLAENSIAYVRFPDDFCMKELNSLWLDTATGNFTGEKIYVVQTNVDVAARCMFLTTSPGDLVLDPTCGSGTTAYVAEQWGRRWIAIDTSRVAVAIARQRLLTACFDTYRTRDPAAGADPNAPQNPAFGFYYKTVPHITLKSIAQNKGLDPIFAKHEPVLAEKLAALNAELEKISRAREQLVAKLLAKVAAEKWSSLTEADMRRWILPGTPPELFQQSGTLSAKQVAVLREFASSREREWQPWQVPFDGDEDWPAALRDALTAYRAAWRAKMNEVNAAIAANAEQEELVDQPLVVKNVARVSGPFTVESMRPPETSLKGGAGTAGAGGGAGGDGVAGAGNGGGEEENSPIGGAPAALPDAFEPTVVPERDASNAASHIERMLEFLRHDGVTFAGNRHVAFARLDALDGSFLHAEGEFAGSGGGDGGANSGANGTAGADGARQVAPEQSGDKSPHSKVAVVIGPEFGSVTRFQVDNALRLAHKRGYDDVIFAGFSFDAQAQETIQAENEDTSVKMRIHMAQIRPDVGMKDLLKKTNKVEQIFTVFGQPRTSVKSAGAGGEIVVRMEGVDLYNPLTNALEATAAGKVAAWFVDTDYDERVFCVCQAFFPDKTAWDKIARALKGAVTEGAFARLSGTESLPFKPGPCRCVAVKVIDPRGNEVMRVHHLGKHTARKEADDEPRASTKTRRRFARRRAAGSGAGGGAGHQQPVRGAKALLGLRQKRPRQQNGRAARRGLFWG